VNARPSPLRHVVLVPLSILVLAPFYLVVVNSFKTRVAILGDPWSIPLQGATLENYQNILSGGSFDVVGSYARSTVITVSTVIVLLLVAAMLAYWVARSSSPIASIIQLLLLMGLIIPPQVTVIPVVKLL
jgi:raffinose/stachyose/melibiose transport system permease protein